VTVSKELKYNSVVKKKEKDRRVNCTTSSFVEAENSKKKSACAFIADYVCRATKSSFDTDATKHNRLNLLC
jgi:hypothetical protein